MMTRRGWDFGFFYPCPFLSQMISILMALRLIFWLSHTNNSCIGRAILYLYPRKTLMPGKVPLSITSVLLLVFSCQCSQVGHCWYIPRYLSSALNAWSESLYYRISIWKYQEFTCDTMSGIPLLCLCINVVRSGGYLTYPCSSTVWLFTGIFLMILCTNH